MLYAVIILGFISSSLFIGFCLLVWDYMKVIIQLQKSMATLALTIDSVSTDLEKQEHSVSKLWEKLDELNLLD